MQLLACMSTGADSLSRLQALADALGIPLLTDMSQIKTCQYLLILEQGVLKLQPADRHRGGPLSVDFHAAGVEYRRQHGGIKQDIARAVGCKPGYRPSVLDATAGLGGDAFVLASLGCQVTLLESHPVVYALLEDGISRAKDVDDETGRIVREHISLLPRQDSLNCLEAKLEGFDVVYLDPMFPERQKSASVKKAMQYFHDLVGFNPEQEGILLQRALLTALKRVVVKRPKLAPLLDGKEPSFQLKGKTIRYDIYLAGRES